MMNRGAYFVESSVHEAYGHLTSPAFEIPGKLIQTSLPDGAVHVVTSGGWLCTHIYSGVEHLQICQSPTVPHPHSNTLHNVDNGRFQHRVRSYSK